MLILILNESFFLCFFVPIIFKGFVAIINPKVDLVNLNQILSIIKVQKRKKTG